MKLERRRTVLRLVGSAALAGLAGCAEDGGTSGGDTEPTETGGAGGNDATAGDRPTGASVATTANTGPSRTDAANGTGSDTTAGEADLSGPVPAAYRTATSQGGTERDPESLQSKAALEYQSHPRGDERCAGCAFYVPDENGDGLGACSVVEGYIQPAAWCASYRPYQDG